MSSEPPRPSLSSVPVCFFCSSSRTTILKALGKELPPVHTTLAAAAVFFGIGVNSAENSRQGKWSRCAFRPD